MKALAENIKYNNYNQQYGKIKDYSRITNQV